MGKKIFGIYLAKLDAPNSEAHARLELPASPWELHDAMDKVQLQENEELYLEIDDYYGFEYLAPHLMELDASLNELNDLAGRLAVLDETEQEAFDGLLRLEIQRKVESNGSILTMQDLRTLAVSAGADCCHVVGATSDAELGRFYAENGFMEELDGLSDDVFEMLDFGKIGKALRTGENGTFTRSGYVVKHSELVTAPPCAKELPEKPEYLFRLTLGLHPDLEDDRTVTLELPASAEALREVQKQLGADGWEGAMVLDYDGIIPQAAEFADLPTELDAFNDFAEAVEAMPSREKQIPKLKALLEHFEVTDLAIWKVFSTKRSMCGIMRATMRFRRERSMKRILFICHGNICRSPMAELVMKDLVKKAGLASQFHIESAATSREEIGNPVYPPARRKLAEHGISCEGHAARQLTNRDYDEYDLLIGMDQANLRDMYRICGGDYVGKMSLLMDHTAHPGNVADPWYTEDFEATWQDVLDGCQGLLKEFMTERGDSNGTKR